MISKLVDKQISYRTFSLGSRSALSRWNSSFLIVERIIVEMQKEILTDMWVPPIHVAENLRCIVLVSRLQSVRGEFVDHAEEDC